MSSFIFHLRNLFFCVLPFLSCSLRMISLLKYTTTITEFKYRFKHSFILLKILRPVKGRVFCKDKDIEPENINDEITIWGDGEKKSFGEFWGEGFQGENPPYFDEAESLEPDHEYYVSKTKVIKPNEIDGRLIDTPTSYFDSVPDDRFGEKPLDLANLIKGWDDFSEEPPYYDDEPDTDVFSPDFLASVYEIIDDSNIIRDSSGTQLGWRDLDENPSSYFDEIYADAVDIEPPKLSPNLSKSRDKIIVPSYDGNISEEWSDWDTEEFIGEESDYGQED